MGSRLRGNDNILHDCNSSENIENLSFPRRRESSAPERRTISEVKVLIGEGRLLRS